jgi:hypothetical protein
LDTNPTFGVFFMAKYDEEVTCASSSPMLIDFRKADASLDLFAVATIANSRSSPSIFHPPEYFASWGLKYPYTADTW